MCPDPGHGGGGGLTTPNCLEASPIGTLGQKKDIGALGQELLEIAKDCRFFLKEKGINGNTGGTGLEKRSENLSSL